jgi:hypothetical protein
MSNYEIVKQFSEIEEGSVSATTKVGAEVAFLCTFGEDFEIRYGIVYGWTEFDNQIIVKIIDTENDQYRIGMSRVKYVA